MSYLIKTIDNEQRSRIILFTIFLFGVFLRVLKLGLAGPVSFDEAWSFWMGSKDLHSLMSIIYTDKQPPFFYLLMHVWNQAGHSEMWIRIPSLLASIVNLPLFFLTARKMLVSSAATLTALLLFAVFPEQITYGANARMYALATTFTLLSFYTFMRILEEPKSKWLIANSMVNFMLIGTHYVGIFSIVTQCGWLLYLAYSRKGSCRIFLNWVLFHLPYLIAGLLFIPIIQSQLHAGGIAPRWIALRLGKPGILDLFFQATLFQSFYFLPFYGRIVVGIMASTIIMCCFVNLRRLPKIGFLHHKRMLLLLIFYLLPIFSFWVISQFEPIFVARYFIPYNFAWCMLVSCGISSQSFKKLRWFFFVVILCCLLGQSYREIAHPYLESNWKEKTKIITENWQSGDALLVVPVSDVIRFKFYAKNDNTTFFDRVLYSRIFRSKPNPVTVTDLKDVFLAPDFPYQRIWFHEETETGLSAEFYLAQESVIFKFLAKHFERVKKFEYKDAHGHLSLFLVK